VTRSARARQRLKIARIQVRYLAEGLESVGEIRNVSRAGLFVAAGDVPRPGSFVALQFRPPRGPLVDLRGQVRWNTQGLDNLAIPAGFGVLLHEPPREYREFYLWAVSEVEGKDPDGVI
jgi:hypothetical protein